MVGERVAVTFKPGHVLKERVAAERSSSEHQGAVQDNKSNSEEKP